MLAGFFAKPIVKVIGYGLIFGAAEQIAVDLTSKLIDEGEKLFKKRDNHHKEKEVEVVVE